MKSQKYTIVGPDGLVGMELFALFQKYGIPSHRIRTLRRGDTPTYAPEERVFLCIPEADAAAVASYAIRQGAIVIDLSRAHRDCSDTPLIIPEINGHLLHSRPRLIASPNCTATLLLMVHCSNTPSMGSSIYPCINLPSSKWCR